MNGLHTLRTLVRRFNLQRFVTPIVSWVEDRRLSQLGRYTARRSSADSVELSGFGKTVVLANMPPHMSEQALSAFERPTMTVLLSRLHKDDVVWDVGANIGLYTRLMSYIVGEQGRVVAFEPSPKTYGELIIGLNSNVTPLQKALSDHDGSALFAAPDDYSPVGRILSSDDKAMEAIIVIKTAKADTLIETGEVPAPHFLKIDVEGHELAVINGMKHLLSTPLCKGVIVEVHFSLLEKSGLPNAATDIERIFHECGLTRQQWIARSHLLAERV